MRKRNIDEELKISYTKMALEWCVENFGVNSRKRKKLILEINDKARIEGRMVFYGIYCFNKNKIVIYISNCETVDDIVSTIIHEYTHYLQSSSLLRYYQKYYYYSQNPFERQAKRNEKKYTKECIGELKKLIR